MSVSMGSSSSNGRRKSLDAELNLVPFIDLLSMCICFLLMTAIWIQVASVQVKQGHGTDAPTQAANQLEMELTFTSATVAQINVKKSGKIVHKASVVASDASLWTSQVDRVLTEMDHALGTGGKKDLFANARITPTNGISYGDLISVMNVLRQHQIVNLGVVPNSAVLTHTNARKVGG